MLAQLSERSELHQVFSDLFDRAGCSIELRLAPLYGGHTGVELRRHRRHRVRAGPQRHRLPAGDGGQVVVNPAKSAPLTLSARTRSW